MERRGRGARSRRPFPGRLHGGETAPATGEPGSAAAGPAAGKFDATVTPITARNHVAADIVDADSTERVAKAIANATTGFHSTTVVSAGFEVRKIAVGTALLNVMRARDQALAAVPKMPAAEDLAIQALLGYLYERRGRRADGAARGCGAGGRDDGTQDKVV